MKIQPKYEDALEQLAEAHFALHQRVNEILFLEGAKLFEPLKDMTLDERDVLKIEQQLFSILEKYPEFKNYIKARQETLPLILSLLTSMKTAPSKDWKQLVETELGLELSKGVRTMAGKLGISYGSTGYIQ